MRHIDFIILFLCFILAFKIGDRIEVKGIEFVDNKFEVTYLDRDVETSFDSPPTIEITGIAELDPVNSTFNFSCKDAAGICL